MKRWNTRDNRNEESPKIDAFLEEVIEVCRKHGMSISHEDGHGSFLVVPFSDGDADCLMHADNSTGERKDD